MRCEKCQAVIAGEEVKKLHGQMLCEQQKILELLREQGPIEPGNLSEHLQVKKADIERELAALRHMEKVKGELRDGKRLVRLWD